MKYLELETVLAFHQCNKVFVREEVNVGSVIEDPGCDLLLFLWSLGLWPAVHGHGKQSAHKREAGLPICLKGKLPVT